MPKSPFKSAAELQERINNYFTNILGDTNEQPDKPTEPATITGFAFSLGFNSREELYDYENRGKFKHILKRALLRIEAEYEKMLHKKAPQAAMFVLKNSGWTSKAAIKTSAKSKSKNLKITLIETGPKPASSEKEVDSIPG